MRAHTPVTESPSGWNDVLIAILPEHAARLYCGDKKYELRRVMPKAIPRRLFLYESDGERKISGHAIVERLLCGKQEDLWEVTGTRATTRTRFFEYFGDSEVAYALE